MGRAPWRENWSAAGPRQGSFSRIRVPRDSWPHLSEICDSPNLEGLKMSRVWIAADNKLLVCLGVGPCYGSQDQSVIFLLLIFNFLILKWVALSDETPSLYCSQYLVQVAQDPYPYFVVSSETGSVIPSCTGFPFFASYELQWIRWRYSNPAPRQMAVLIKISTPTTLSVAVQLVCLSIVAIVTKPLPINGCCTVAYFAVVA
jgi:hypothetical protein